MKSIRKYLSASFFTLIFFNLQFGAAEAQQKLKELNVYSSRHYGVDDELFKKFENETGIKINLIQIKEAAQLIERVKIEGKKSPADVIITVDIGNAWKAEQADLFQSISTPTLKSAVPSNLIGAKDMWYALTLRGRAIVYDKTRVNVKELQDYEDLANDKFKGRLLIRSSNHVYNQSLVSSLVTANGENQTEVWAKKVTENLARKPEGGDIDQMKAISLGKGDLAVVNTYYYARLLKSIEPEDQKIVKNLGIIFPNQKGRGMHVNASIVGISKYSPNKANAIQFIEFMVSKDVQETLAQMNNEYPVRNDVEWSLVLKNLGKPKFDTVNLSKLGENTPKAIFILDKAGWR